jgi:methylthioribose-1-phosphate isomerase
MKIGDTWYRTIWPVAEGFEVEIIDQTLLPHEFSTRRLREPEDAAEAISAMRVRGAPLIGATAAYGIVAALRRDSSDENLDRALKMLGSTRPTAVNLHWALREMEAAVRPLDSERRAEAARVRAGEICDEDVEICRSIGKHGLRIFRKIAAAKGSKPLNVLTHCNAGWLATVDWGTALAPIYMAHDEGLPVHVWVDETRPRSQGAAITAFELGAHGVPHTLITDNAGGHLMQHGLVDLCIVGTDRTTSTGDVANKIGTYLKALAAADNGVPFYVALPSTTIDWSAADGLTEIPIEERSADEVTRIPGRDADGRVVAVDIAPEGCPAANYAFDVTPARLVTGLITERGVCRASRDDLAQMFADRVYDGANG